MQKGFTLIELLIVIAIIGILAAVVFNSLGDARQLGIETKIKGEMDMLRKVASLEESTSLTYDTVCGSNGFSTSTKILELIASIERFASSSVVCNSSTTEFAVSIDLPFTDYWCVDSTGKSQAATAQLNVSPPQLVCP